MVVNSLSIVLDLYKLRIYVKEMIKYNQRGNAIFT